MIREKFIDLHFHSHYSDGFCSPKELSQRAKERGISIISLTDHNGVAGIEEMNFWSKKMGIKNIPGIEIYTHFKKFSLHLLGYGFDVKNKELSNALEKLQKQKAPIIKNCLKELKNDGWEIDEKQIFSTPAVYLGVVHLANAIKIGKKNQQTIKKDFNLKKDDIVFITEIIARYFFKDHQPLCPETEISTIEAIKLIHQAGGDAVLAHPGQQLSFKDDDLIEELKGGGLDGLEAISSHYNWQGIEHWQRLAKKLKLFVTAGSDFHGDVPKEWGFSVSGVWDYFKVSDDFYKNCLGRYL